MDNFSSFDKLNIPIYICDDEWKVIFRNRACKKYTNSPRLNGSLDKCFIDRSGTLFPEKNGEMFFISCFVSNTYKTALCFEYHEKAMVIFPTLLEFDLLFSDMENKRDKNTIHLLREVFDTVLCNGFEQVDKYGRLEKLRKYMLSAIENYVTLSMFDVEKRVLGSFMQIYSFFLNSIVKIANKAGCKIETDLSGIMDFGDTIYTDTMYFTSVLSGLLLFCLAVSYDKKCIVSPEHLGTSVRNMIRFTIRDEKLFGKEGDSLKELMKIFPNEYLNVIPYDELCHALCWRLHYSITDGKTMNGAIWFDIDNDNSAIFRSGGTAGFITPEEIILDILANAFLIL